MHCHFDSRVSECAHEGCRPFLADERSRCLGIGSKVIRLHFVRELTVVMCSCCFLSSSVM